MRVKNWNKYQHYRHRSPPWIKFHRTLLNDPEWFALDGDASKVLAMCWLVAAETDGKLPPLAKLAFRLRMKPAELQKQIAKLSHWLEIDASTTLADCKQDASNLLPQSQSTERESETKIEIRASDLDFEEFRRSYPKRDGANPKAPARQKFFALVKSGVDPAAMIAGARSYAAAEAKNIGTPYIAQMVVFLNQRRWEDYAAATGPPQPYRPTDPNLPTHEELKARYAQRSTVQESSPKGGGVLEESIPLCPNKPNGLGMGRAGNGAIRKLGEILPNQGLGTFRGSADPQGNNSRNDNAD